MSYANAFAEPVRMHSAGIVSGSAAKLKAEIDKTDVAFGIAGERFWFSPDGYPKPEKAQTCTSLQELAERSAAAWKEA